MRSSGEGFLSQREPFKERISITFVVLTNSGKTKRGRYKKPLYGPHPMQIFLIICFVAQNNLKQGNIFVLDLVEMLFRIGQICDCYSVKVKSMPTDELSGCYYNIATLIIA